MSQIPVVFEELIYAIGIIFRKIFKVKRRIFILNEVIKP